MSKKDTMISILQLQSARARGEKVSEFTSARTHAEFYINHIIDALNSGVPYSEAVSFLSINAGCGRHVAYDVLGKVLRKAGYIRPEDTAKPSTQVTLREKTKAPVDKKFVEPVIHVAEKPKPAIKPSPVPIPVPSAGVFSDATEYKKGTAIPMLDSAHARTPESPPQNKTSKHKWVDGVFAGENDQVTEEDKEFALRSEKFLKAFPLEKEIARINKMQDEARARGETIPDNNGESIGTFNVVDGGGLK